MADCPECEYCCAIGLCCPDSSAQLKAATDLFVNAGVSLAEAGKAAQALVDAKAKAQKKAKG